MEALLATYSIQQILIFIVMLAFAFKGVVEFFKWCKNLYNEKFNKDYQKLKKEENIERQYKMCEEHRQQFLDKYSSLETKIDYLTNEISSEIKTLKNQLEVLTLSDMHDIKGWIVEKHHNLMKQGWVDDFTMDCIEHRYSDYKEEKGNSYVASLMIELRALPKFPPEKNLSE